MIDSGDFCMCQIAMEEVEAKAPDCGIWLRTAKMRQCVITEEVLQEALSIKLSLGIENDNYHPKGVDENDVLIIASAKIEGLELITDESRQLKPPIDSKKYKIPAVCSMEGVSVASSSFLELIKKSGKVF